MKKIFSLIILCSFVVLANAQLSGGKVTRTFTLDVPQFYIPYTGVSADSVTSIDTAFVINVAVNKGSRLFYDIKVETKRISGTGTAYVQLLGYKFGDDTPTSIAGTKIWNTVDTTVTFTENSTIRFWRAYQVKISYKTGTTKIQPKVIYESFRY